MNNKQSVQGGVASCMFVHIHSSICILYKAKGVALCLGSSKCMY